ncbi:MAG: DUF885 domain-containing protein [Parvularculaceae bacterium]
MSPSRKSKMFLQSCVIAMAAALTACGADQSATTPAQPETSVEQSAQAQTQSEQLNAWFAARWEEDLERSPETRTFLGEKIDYDKWDDETDAARQEDHQRTIDHLAEMRATFDPDQLDPSTRLSYRLYEYMAEQQLAAWPYRDHWYVFSHFRGPHTSIPVFLANQHRVDTVSDAEAYIARLEGVKEHLGQYRTRAEAQFAAGIYPPQWSYDKMLITIGNLMTGAPFDDSAEPSAMLQDATRKIDALDIDQATKDDLLMRATNALVASVKPAYDDLTAMMQTQRAAAGDDDGAWKLPDGAGYYSQNLERMTTTTLTAAEIHDLGLSEVARIHDEMRAIMTKVGFDGTLQEFFQYMRDDPEQRFTYPNTDEGRAQYLARATAIIDNMRSRLDEQFITKPKAAIEVRRVEPYREKAAGKGFYQRPAPDGSRPGIYYANLANMADMPIYQMEALAYHEGIPGHHMQLAIMQELDGLPSFRRFGGFTAYTEGWGLYSEYLPKTMGLYEDPYSDFGRLAMELWRAARLVVDTGLHDKRWTREQAVQYLLTNTPNPEGDCRNAIDRYIVMPGQATAYKIGMLKLLELRAGAEAALGDDFDVREFHDAVLDQGALPLAVLEEEIDKWIVSKQED